MKVEVKIKAEVTAIIELADGESINDFNEFRYVDIFIMGVENKKGGSDICFFYIVSAATIALLVE